MFFIPIGTINKHNTKYILFYNSVLCTINIPGGISMLKKFLTFTLLCTIIFSTLFTNVYASSNNATLVEIEYLDDGYYIETYIEDSGFDIDIQPMNSIITSSVNFITKTKTGYFKNASNENVWSFSITGSFRYDGTTATCTYRMHNAESYNKDWTITSCTSTKLGNSATATAVASYLKTYSYTRMISISCSPTGVIS